MLRISDIHKGDHLTLKLEGRLLGPWTGELRSVYCRFAKNASVQLDLHDLLFADAEGILTLRELIRGGAVLTCCSNFISEALGADAQWEGRTHA